MIAMCQPNSCCCVTKSILHQQMRSYRTESIELYKKVAESDGYVPNHQPLLYKLLYNKFNWINRYTVTSQSPSDYINKYQKMMAYGYASTKQLLLYNKINIASTDTQLTFRAPPSPGDTNKWHKVMVMCQIA